MKIVIAGRFDYIKAAWESTVSDNSFIYFDNDSNNYNFLVKLWRRLYNLAFKLRLISKTSYDTFLRIDNYRELFDIDSIKKREEVWFILYEMNVLAADFKGIELLKKRFKNSKFVLFFTNTIGSVRPELTNKILSNSNLYNIIYTFNPLDANKYGFKLFCGGVFPYDLPKNHMEYDDKYAYDVFWIGKNKNRFDTLNRISKELTKKGFKVLFIVVDELKKQSTDYVKVIPDSIPYSEYIKYIYNSKCLLEIDNNGAPTLRYSEAIAYGKTLITNNKQLISMPLFNESQILFFEDINDINTDIFQNYSLGKIDPRLISTKNFLSDIRKNLKE